MNVYDSEKMADILQNKCKMESVSDPEAADLLVINTCSIREKSQEKLFSELGRWKAIKNSNKKSQGRAANEFNGEALIAVAGCVAAQEGKNIVERAPYVDIVFGPQTLHRLPQMIEERMALRAKANREGKKGEGVKHSVVDISFPEIEKFDNLAPPKARGVSAFVSIMEGCSKYCSFCVVPYTRGEEISRPVRQIREEILRLTDQGVKEIYLLGQNVNAYDYEGIDFAQLLYMVADMPNVERIRFTSSHPVEFNDAQIKCYGEIPQLANHLHLPVQCGSDRILSLMKRGHTALEYKEKIYKLRDLCPDIAISSDFIVGFPGETDEEHQATMKLVKAIGFDKSFSFVYSARPGTPAASLRDATPQEEKLARLHELQQVLDQQTADISNALIGKTCSVLVDDYSRKDPGRLQGRTECNRLVNFQCADSSLIGEFVQVEILGASRTFMRGVLVSELPAVAGLKGMKGLEGLKSKGEYGAA